MGFTLLLQLYFVPIIPSQATGHPIRLALVCWLVIFLVVLRNTIDDSRPLPDWRIKMENKVFVLTPHGDAWRSENVPIGHEHEAIEKLLRHPMLNPDRGSVRFQLKCQMFSVRDFPNLQTANNVEEAEVIESVTFIYDSRWRFGNEHRR